MNLNEFLSELPESAKEMRLNAKMVLSEEGAPSLTQQQILRIAIAVAYALGDQALIFALRETDMGSIDENDLKAAQTAAITMGMNNIYYRFVHIVDNHHYTQLSAKLRMNSLMNTGISQPEFEQLSLAVSAINGCGLCIHSHVKALEDGGMDKTSIQSIIRISAVINALHTAHQIGELS